MKAARAPTSAPVAVASVLKTVAIVVATVLVVSLLVVSLGRLFYPYELEWMEGGSVDHVRWLLAKHPLYVPPTLAFIPYIYTPIYYYVASFLCRLVGVGFWPMRAISIAATLLTLVVLYRLLRHEIKSRYVAYLGAALYAGTFPLTGYWFDLARVDPLEILFLALALYLARRYQGVRAAIAAGLFVSLGFLTKQTAAAAVLPIGVYLFGQSRRRFVAFLASVGLFAGGGFLLLDHLHDGWLRYYTVTLPSSHEVKIPALLDFWTDDVIRLLPLAIGAAVAGYLVRRGGALRSTLLFYGMVLLVFLATSYSSRIHAGGEKNVLMPALLAAALVFAVAAQILHGLAQTAPPSGASARKLAPCALVILQLSLLLYLPWRQIPTASDRLAADAFIDLLRHLDGDVYVMDHGYYPAMAGKRTFAQGMALVDVLRGDRGPAAQAVASELASAVRSRRFGAVIVGTDVPAGLAVDNPSWNEGVHLPWLPADFTAGLARFYQPGTHLFRDSRDFAPVVGWRRRPAVVYLPASAGQQATP